MFSDARAHGGITLQKKKTEKKRGIGFLKNFAHSTASVIDGFLILFSQEKQRNDGVFHLDLERVYNNRWKAVPADEINPDPPSPRSMASKTYPSMVSGGS